MRQVPDVKDQLAALLKAVVAGERVAERDFDLLFPKEARKFARAEWTPLQAAVRAAQLLVLTPGARILDVGSGAGKFCFVGALTTTGNFTGVEADEHLVSIAKEITRSQKIPRVTFAHSDVLRLDWTNYAGLYFFNPFANSALDEAEFLETIAIVTAKLAALPCATRVVTYHGFGGTMPGTFVQEVAEAVGPGLLQLWVQS